MLARCRDWWDSIDILTNGQPLPVVNFLIISDCALHWPRDTYNDLTGHLFLVHTARQGVSLLNFERHRRVFSVELHPGVHPVIET